jgi:hypothetical protein
MTIAFGDMKKERNDAARDRKEQIVAVFLVGSKTWQFVTSRDQFGPPLG